MRFSFKMDTIVINEEDERGVVLEMKEDSKGLTTRQRKRRRDQRRWKVMGRRPLLAVGGSGSRRAPVSGLKGGGVARVVKEEGIGQGAMGICASGQDVRVEIATVLKQWLVDGVLHRVTVAEWAASEVLLAVRKLVSGLKEDWRARLWAVTRYIHRCRGLSSYRLPVASSGSVLVHLLSDSMFKQAEMEGMKLCGVELCIAGVGGERVDGLVDRLKDFRAGPCSAIVFNHAINYSRRGIVVKELRSAVARLRVVARSVAPVGSLVYFWPPYVPTLSRRENEIVQEAAQLISEAADRVLRVPQGFLRDRDWSLMAPHWSTRAQQRMVEWVAEEVARMVWE